MVLVVDGAHGHDHDHTHDPGVSSVSIVCEGSLDLDKVFFFSKVLIFLFFYLCSE